MTNKEINKLGDRIAYAQAVDLVHRDDLDLLQEFRKTYKDPLAKTFNRLLLLAGKVDKGAIVTYRIKRINTIIRKLQYVFRTISVQCSGDTRSLLSGEDRLSATKLILFS